MTRLKLDLSRVWWAKGENWNPLEYLRHPEKLIDSWQVDKNIAPVVRVPDDETTGVSDLIEAGAQFAADFHRPTLELTSAVIDAALIQGALADRTERVKLDTPHGERVAYVSFPDPDRFPEPRGLILNMHGFSDTALLHAHVTDMATQGTDRGYVVVHPQGIPGVLDLSEVAEPALTQWASNMVTSWQSWEELPGDAPILEKGDVEFLSAFLDGSALPDLPQGGRYRPQKKVLTGFSNGAMMSFMLASRVEDVILAVNGGAMLPSFEAAGGRPLATLIMHGRHDPLVPLEGTPPGTEHPEQLGVLAGAARIAAHNGHGSEAEVFKASRIDSLEDAIASAGDAGDDAPIEVHGWGRGTEHPVIAIVGDFAHAVAGHEIPFIGQVATPLRGTDRFDATRLTLEFVESLEPRGDD